MKQLKDGTVVRVKQKNGEYRQLGKVYGDTFITFERDEGRHLFRGGAETAQEAMVEKLACWGLDTEVCERLYRDHGIRFVEIPTKRCRYRTKMEMFLGPKAFIVEYGGHRPQYMLNLEYFTEVPVKSQTTEDVSTVPYTKFGETRLVPIRVVGPAHVSFGPPRWDAELWVERPEDMYALSSPELRNKRVLVVRREDWLKAPKVNEGSDAA